MDEEDDTCTSLRCSKCEGLMSIAGYPSHKNRHRALHRLKYTGIGGPTSLELLFQRRRSILHKLYQKFRLKPDDPDLMRRISKVNEAFDTIRSELIRGQSVQLCVHPLLEKPSGQEGNLRFSDEEIEEDISSCSISHNAGSAKLPKCIAAIGASEATNIQSKNVMEDRTTLLDDYTSLDVTTNESHPSYFIGMFDGHWGVTSAETCRQQYASFLKQSLNEEKQKFSGLDYENLHGSYPTSGAVDTLVSNILPAKSVMKSFQVTQRKMDKELFYGIGESSRVRWSGCSTLACLITDETLDTKQRSDKGDGDVDDIDSKLSHVSGRLFMANAGNVQGVLFHGSNTSYLTKLHDLHNEDEVKRLQDIDGIVLGHDNNKKVNAVLPITRGLGNHGDPKLRKCVIPEAFTSTATINDYSQFAIFATSGFWSVVGIDEAFYIVKSLPTTHHKNNSSLTVGNDDPLTDLNSFYNTPYDSKRLPSIVETSHETEPSTNGDEDAQDGTSSEKSGNTATNHTVSTQISAQSPTSLQVSQATSYAEYSQLASSRLVRAAISLGSTENISVVVIFFPAYFKQTA